MSLKEELKSDAAKIRENNLEIKRLQKNGEYAGNLQFSRISLKKNFRHKHIAYCMLRGRTYEQIESKCGEKNKPDFDKIKEIMDEYEYAKENVCVSA